MDKNKAVIDFLITCPYIQNTPLYFNLINAKDNTKQVITLGNDKAVEEPYIDGSVLKRYTFTLVDFRSVSYNPIVKTNVEGNENIDEYWDVQGTIDWVTEQDVEGNYPDFGTDCIIDKMEVLTDNPTLDSIDVTVTPALARYSFTIRIEYLDKSKCIWN